MINKTYIFDFDGVLSNSIKVGYEMHNNISDKYNVPVIDNKNDYLKIVDNHHLKSYVEEDKIKEYYLECNSYYEERINEIEVFPELTDYLKKNRVIIISSIPDRFIKEILKRSGIEEVIVYGKEVARTKQERLEMAMNDYNLDKDNINYIGDTQNDYLFCTKVGIPMIGCNYGYSNLEEIKDNLHLLVTTREELLEVLKNNL